MKIITKANLLARASKKRNREELQELMELILLENNDWWLEDRVWIDEHDHELWLNVDETSFFLGKVNLEKWLQENTDCDTDSDKRWRVFGLKRQ
tara:strand:+ start:1121 stop:1402 length:282 start_codon:yes stop_codon:yes gene_type:complete